MEQIIAGVAIYLLIEGSKLLSKKLKKKISARLLAVVFCLIAWGVYYYFQQTNPEIVNEVRMFVIWSFAMSQGMRMFLDKILPKNDQTR